MLNTYRPIEQNQSKESMILLVPPSCFLLAEGDIGNNATMRLRTYSFSKLTMLL